MIWTKSTCSRYSTGWRERKRPAAVLCRSSINTHHSPVATTTTTTTTDDDDDNQGKKRHRRFAGTVLAARLGLDWLEGNEQPKFRAWPKPTQAKSGALR
ncbi:predicted protein [Plenodomus lingam JN3]|uniref:Predicted protein n=1 Tax=Leptosphaeria maculans (strain JN3 / isolate v23.1.3 / race Av1-4-5-6-7-8) TaxID=985895 RepID=E4ZZ73_LEPMJ|nr:predicted protein [Plenodomus lingam JN3]CBX96668.1 predicted protein [Plenodomus lingam JN3]